MIIIKIRGVPEVIGSHCQIMFDGKEQLLVSQSPHEKGLFTKYITIDLEN